MSKNTITTEAFLEKVKQRATKVAQENGLSKEDTAEFVDNFADEDESDGYNILELEGFWGKHKELATEVVQCVEQDGGGEGGAESCHIILKVDGEYWQYNYSYYSHHGYEHYNNTLMQVFPKEKTVTVFE
jgi:hypothetical protein